MAAKGMKKTTGDDVEEVAPAWVAYAGVAAIVVVAVVIAFVLWPSVAPAPTPIPTAVPSTAGSRAVDTPPDTLPAVSDEVRGSVLDAARSEGIDPGDGTGAGVRYDGDTNHVVLSVSVISGSSMKVKSYRFALAADGTWKQ